MTCGCGNSGAPSPETTKLLTDLGVPTEADIKRLLGEGVFRSGESKGTIGVGGNDYRRLSRFDFGASNKALRYEGTDTWNVICVGPQSTHSDFYIVPESEEEATVTQKHYFGVKRPFIGEVTGPFSIVPAKDVRIADSGRLPAITNPTELVALNAVDDLIGLDLQSYAEVEMYKGTIPFVPKSRPSFEWTFEIDAFDDADALFTAPPGELVLPVFGRQKIEVSITADAFVTAVNVDYEIRGWKIVGTTTPGISIAGRDGYSFETLDSGTLSDNQSAIYAGAVAFDFIVIDLSLNAAGSFNGSLMVTVHDEE